MVTKFKMLRSLSPRSRNALKSVRGLPPLSSEEETFLDSVRDHSLVAQHDIVRLARDPDCPLHARFEWDDELALAEAVQSGDFRRLNIAAIAPRESGSCVQWRKMTAQESGQRTRLTMALGIILVFRSQQQTKDS